MQLKVIPILLILSLGATIVFGFWSFNLINHSEYHLCPFSIASGGDCSSFNTSLALAIHHLSGLKDFTYATINFNLLTSFFLIIVSLLLLRSLFSEILSNQTSFYQRYYRNKETLFRSYKSFLRWLVLCNKRDPYAFAWARSNF